MTNDNQLSTILIIAGSDSGGGAGIQADIKTACAHGVFATTALTALTAQNTQGVSSIHDVPAEFVGQQIDAVLNDIQIDAIKIGMLNNIDVINIVGDRIKDLGISVILDPVMVSSSGHKLLNDNAIEALKEKLFPLATLITPNIPEAEILGEIDTPHLLKGGHMEGDEIIDTLITKNHQTQYPNSKIPTNNSHGTGCTLSTAIACNLANGQQLKQAVQNAINYVRKAIQTGPDIGKGKNKPLGFS